MEELVLVLGSVAGACTAVAMDKIPKRRNNKQIIGTSSTIKSQIQSLKIEKEILTKTISRLYQQESELSKVNRDKLLLRYQHQLGITITRIEKLEMASKHPDLGPLGDGLITLMDQKLSHLDQRLNEISSKITITTVPVSQTKQSEPIKEIVYEKPQMKKVEIKTDIQKPKEEYASKPFIEIPIPENHRSVEITTLTEIPDRIPEFPLEFVKPAVATPKQIIKQEVINPVVEIEQSKQVEIQPLEIPKPIIEIPHLEQQTPTEKKIQIPTALKIPEEEKLEEDDKDIDKIKSEIMKALSKLEQVEVE
ncbi:MAG: hypothetical protein HY223_06530 [Thaumarchaeota archaeon]|nr:hypothetical protein [Nitrososphaerota archaeon]MBI3639954.1 hypothetical protein [Nitrososphaerota archaeon]